jgi:hypothetical protein
VSNKNDFYEKMVKINGRADPLRKTLIIIDEAHKLFGGDDLLTIEKPDMFALHNAIMNSYDISGDNSVRLLLMSATPITSDAMEFVKLINLFKEPNEQMPTIFNQFADEYLNEDGKFTERGKKRIMDEYAGHISYLNREYDVREFAQPKIQTVYVDISKYGIHTKIDKLDKNNIASILSRNVVEYVEKINDVDESIEKLQIIVDKRNEIETPLNKLCETVKDCIYKEQCYSFIKEKIDKFVKMVKEKKDDLKNVKKKMSDELKSKKGYNMETLKRVREYIKNNPNEFERFNKTPYYKLKYKCISKQKKETSLKEAFDAIPLIQSINRIVLDGDMKMKQLYDERNKFIEMKAQIQELVALVPSIKDEKELKQIRRMIDFKKEDYYDDKDEYIARYKDAMADYRKTIAPNKRILKRYYDNFMDNVNNLYKVKFKTEQEMKPFNVEDIDDAELKEYFKQLYIDVNIGISNCEVLTKAKKDKLDREATSWSKYIFGVILGYMVYAIVLGGKKTRKRKR